MELRVPSIGLNTCPCKMRSIHGSLGGLLPLRHTAHKVSLCCLAGGRLLLEIPLQCKSSRQQYKPQVFDKSFCDISIQCHCYHVPVNTFTGALPKWKYKMGRNPFKEKLTSGIAEFIWTFGGGNEVEPALIMSNTKIIAHFFFNTHLLGFTSLSGLVQLHT